MGGTDCANWTTALKYKQLSRSPRSDADLLNVFDQVATVLDGISGPAQYDTALKLTLIQLYEEQQRRAVRFRHRTPKRLRRDQALPSESRYLQVMTTSLRRALRYFAQAASGEIRLRVEFKCPVLMLRKAAGLLAEYTLSNLRPKLLSMFYVRFSDDAHQSDLAQIFTPGAVAAFIARLAELKQGQTVYDPACGAADLLVASHELQARVQVYGADRSALATTIATLNCQVNGVRHSQVTQQDSFEAFGVDSPTYHVVLGNGPFGVRVVEYRHEVLAKFDLGRIVQNEGERGERMEGVRNSQQKGILFAELCVLSCRENGRIVMLVPNGYLGNRGSLYVGLRDWILRYCRLLAVIGLPRFAFHLHGGDVSASVLVLERRTSPIASVFDDAQYYVFVACVDAIDTPRPATPHFKGKERATQVPRSRNQNIDGTAAADLGDIGRQFLRWSRSSKHRTVNRSKAVVRDGSLAAGVPIQTILQTGDLNIDPKRYCEKVRAARSAVQRIPHVCLRDVLRIVPVSPPSINPLETYRYVDIDAIGIGEAKYEDRKGADLPTRARFLATPGDLYLCHIWSSVGKWFLAPDGCIEARLIVTSGCTGFRLKDGAEELLPDLAVGFCSELFRVQMRALARGSDGLAEIVTDDLLSIVLPRIGTAPGRFRVAGRLQRMRRGEHTLAALAQSVIVTSEGFPIIPPRPFHWSLV